MSASNSLTANFMQSKSTKNANKLNSSWPVREKPVRMEQLEKELAEKLLQDMIETSSGQVNTVQRLEGG